MATLAGRFKKRIFFLKVFFVSITCVVGSLLLAGTQAEEQVAAPHNDLSCYRITEKGHTFTICVPKTPAFTSKDLATFGLTGIALLISVGSLVYTYRKDKKLRKQSIRDEFWIRRILGPIALEPLIKELSSAMSKLPHDCSSKTWNSAELDEFGKNFQSRNQELASACQSLAIIDKEVCKTILSELDEAEDAVIDYCAANMLSKKNAHSKTCAFPRVETQAKIQQILVNIAGSIESYQLRNL